MANYQLIVLSGPNPGKVFTLDKPEMFIGRELGNDIVLNDPEVSRRHARLFLQGAAYVIEDMGSTNGTTVNTQRLMGPYGLKNGEIVQLGETIRLEVRVAQPAADATVVAGVHPTAEVDMGRLPPVPQTAYTPPPPPAFSPPPYQPPAYTPPPQAFTPPPPAFNSQPLPLAEEPPKKKKASTWLIILIIGVVLLLCGCVALMLVIDTTNSWCSIFGFVFNAVSPGLCP